MVKRLQTSISQVLKFGARLSSGEEHDCHTTQYTAPLDYCKLPHKLAAELCVKLSDNLLCKLWE